MHLTLIHQVLKRDWMARRAAAQIVRLSKKESLRKAHSDPRCASDCISSVVDFGSLFHLEQGMQLFICSAGDIACQPQTDACGGAWVANERRRLPNRDRRRKTGPPRVRAGPMNPLPMSVTPAASQTSVCAGTGMMRQAFGSTRPRRWGRESRYRQPMPQLSSTTISSRVDRPSGLCRG